MATQGWLCPTRANRLLFFDGSLLHGVVPAPGPSPRGTQARVTLMVAFWTRRLPMPGEQDKHDLPPRKHLRAGTSPLLSPQHDAPRAKCARGSSLWAAGAAGVAGARGGEDEGRELLNADDGKACARHEVASKACARHDGRACTSHDQAAHEAAGGREEQVSHGEARPQVHEVGARTGRRSKLGGGMPYPPADAPPWLSLVRGEDVGRLVGIGAGEEAACQGEVSKVALMHVKPLWVPVPAASSPSIPHDFVSAFSSNARTLKQASAWSRPSSTSTHSKHDDDEEAAAPPQVSAHSSPPPLPLMPMSKCFQGVTPWRPTADGLYLNPNDPGILRAP